MQEKLAPARLQEITIMSSYKEVLYYDLLESNNFFIIGVSLNFYIC